MERLGCRHFGAAWLDIVINNAGVTPAASAKDQTHDDFAWPMSINFWGVVYGT